MKYSKMILFGVLIILIISSFFLFIRGKIKEENMHTKMYLSDGNYIEIDKENINIYKNEDEIIECYSFEEKIKDYDIGHITKESKEFLVILTEVEKQEYGKDIVIFSLDNNIKEVYRKSFSKLNPWKVIIGDIDGDKIEEISIGVYKESPLHPVMAKRPFIYSYIDEKIEPKWRGSRLSRPFIDYIFFDIDEDGIDEIISMEILEDNRKIISSYKWRGFGFEIYLESEIFHDIEDINVKEDKLYINIKDKGERYLSIIKIQDEKLIIERVD